MMTCLVTKSMFFFCVLGLIVCTVHNVEGACHSYYTTTYGSERVQNHDFKFVWPKLSNGITSFNVSVRASNDVYLILSPTKYVVTNDTHNDMGITQIVIGGWCNTESGVACNSTTDWDKFNSPDILDPSEFKEFHVSFANDVLQVRSAGERPFIRHNMTCPQEINYIGITSGHGSNANWTYCTKPITTKTKNSTATPMTTIIGGVTTSQSTTEDSTAVLKTTLTESITTIIQSTAQGSTAAPTITTTGGFTIDSSTGGPASTLTDNIATGYGTTVGSSAAHITALKESDTTDTSTPRHMTTLTDGILSPTTVVGGNTAPTTPSTTSDTTSLNTTAFAVTSRDGLTTSLSTAIPITTLADDKTTAKDTNAAVDKTIVKNINAADEKTTAKDTNAADEKTTAKDTNTASSTTLTDAITTGSRTAKRITVVLTDDVTSTIQSTITGSTAAATTTSTDEITTIVGTAIPLITLTEGISTSSSTYRDSTASPATTFADQKVNEVPTIDEFENIASFVRQNRTFDTADLVIKDLSITEMMDVRFGEEGSITVVRLQTMKPVRAIITQSRNLHTQVSTKFKGNQEAESRIVSRVVSIDLFDQITGEEISSLEQPVTIVFDTMKPYIPPAEKWEITPRCSFWNRVDGVWTNDGCNMVAVEGSKVECECDHLTSFAVLMQIVSYPLSPTDEKVLGVLTTLGLSVSVVCICLTLAIYAYCQLLAVPRFMIHTNLCVALLNSHLIFLAGIDVNKNQEKACIAIAFLLHYFLMSTFCWMLVEAMYLLIKTKASLSRRKVPVLVWIAVGWGIPLIVVVISALINLEGYGYPVYGFSGDNEIIKAFRCWLEIDTGMIWAFAGPACFIIMINLAILVMVLSTFLGLKATKSQSQLRRIKSSIRVVLILGAILGLPWIFSLLNFSQYTVVFNYLFVLTNAFQGVFILINQCLIVEEVQTKLKPLIHVLQRMTTRNHGNRARSNQFFMTVRPSRVHDESSGIPNPTVTTSECGTGN